MRRLSALVACTLAVSMAAGVATPRLRVAARERVVRTGLTRTGSLRDGAPGWTAPGLFQPDLATGQPDLATGADSVAPEQREMPALVPGGWRPAAGVTAAAVISSPPARSFASGRPTRSGRAPPLA